MTTVSGGTPLKSRPRTGLGTKLFYGLGSVAYGVKDNGFSSFLLLFYNQVLGLRAELVGAAIMIALVVDSVLDPIVGQISDNWRSRWGRRHPFMYFAAVPAAVAFVLLWKPPAGLSQGELFTWLLLVAILVRSLITLYEIPSTALGAELSENYDQRTSLFGYRFFFGWWGGLTMTILALGFILRPDATHKVGQLNPDGYALYGIISGVIMVAAIVISAAGTHRFIPYLLAPAKGATKTLKQSFSEVMGVLRNPSFLSIMLASLCVSMSGGLALALNSYFVTYFWMLSSAQYSIVLGSAYLGSFLALLLAPRLSRRFGKKPTTMALYFLSAVIGPLPIILRLLGLFPLTGSPLVVPLLFANTTLSLTLSISANIMGTSMIADIAEDIQVRTGQRSEGLLFSAASVIAKAVTGIGIGASGLILLLVHFPEKAQPGHVPTEILNNLMLTYLPVLFVLQGGAIALISGYKITRQRHEENLRKLADMAAQTLEA
jgi:Na+/melibiose symporter-like transporter